MIRNPFHVNRCAHECIRPIHGDEIHALGGHRLECLDCGLLLDGPVRLANWREVIGDDPNAHPVRHAAGRLWTPIRRALDAES